MINPMYGSFQFPIFSIHDFNKVNGFTLPPRLAEHYKRQKKAEGKILTVIYLLTLHANL